MGSGAGKEAFLAMYVLEAILLNCTSKILRYLSFNFYLKGKGTVDDIAEATIFFTGENKWRKFASMACQRSVGITNCLLHSNGKLIFDAHTTCDPTKKAGTVSFSEYISDPAHRFLTQKTFTTTRTREYMTDDQRFASSRPDVLEF